MKTNSKEKARTKKKVAFWFDSNLMTLLDELAKKFGITRAAFVRLLTRQALVSHGLLKPENGSLYRKMEVVVDEEKYNS